MIHTVINVVDIILTIGMIYLLIYRVFEVKRLNAEQGSYDTWPMHLHQFFYIYARGGRRGFIRSFSHVFGIILWIGGLVVVFGLFILGFRGVASVILFQSIFPVLLSCFIQPPYWWTDYERRMFDQL